MPNGCVEKERRLVWPPLASLIIHFATSDTPPPTTIEWGERRNVRYGMHFFPSWAEASRTLLPPVELYPPGIAIKLIELTTTRNFYSAPKKILARELFSLFPRESWSRVGKCDPLERTHDGRKRENKRKKIEEERLNSLFLRKNSTAGQGGETPFFSFEHAIFCKMREVGGSGTMYFTAAIR